MEYLKLNPNTKTQTIDNKKEEFLDKLEPYGFPPEKKENDYLVSTTLSSTTTSTSANDSASNSSNNNNNAVQNTANQKESPATKVGSNSDAISTGNDKGLTKHSTKRKPSLKRKQLPSGLKKLINECYSLDESSFPNAKTALTRVVLECTLKYVVENTHKPNNKPIKESNHFSPAFKDRKNNLLPYTNFDTLKSKFTLLIKDTSTRKALEDFDMQKTHQIIHNYKVEAGPVDAKALCDNLIHLLEFLLQEEKELVNSLDLTKL